MNNIFSGKSEIYAAARPDYPEELFDFLLDERILDKNSEVADVGAGTGIFSRGLAEKVKTVYSVEPDADMLKKGREINNIVQVCATAENTGLKDCSVDAVSAAQAFHWFDAEKFRNECRRILKKDGYVLLVWNDRDENNGFIKENIRVNKEFCKNFRGFSNGFDENNGTIEKFFSGNFKKKEFENRLFYGKNDFILRYLSSSYAPLKDENVFFDYVAALVKIFDGYQKNGVVNYPYITRCYYGQI